MSSQRHIIGRTVLELDSGTLADVWELQETMSRLLQHQAMAELEPLFDQLAGAEEVIRLDQVEVDLGAIAPHALEEEFVPALVKAVREALRDRLIQNQLQRQIYAQSQATDIDLVRHSRARSDWEIFLFFLQYGRLPWWQMETHWQTWLERWRSVVDTTSTWQAPLHRVLANNPVAQRRLLSQLPNAFLYGLIRQSQPNGTRYSAVLAQAQRLAQGLNLRTDIKTRLERYRLQLIMQQLNPNQASALSPAVWIRQWLTALTATWSPPLVSNSNASASAQRVYQQLRQALGAIRNGERSLWDAAIDDVMGTRSPQDTVTEDRATSQAQQASTTGGAGAEMSSQDIPIENTSDSTDGERSPQKTTIDASVASAESAKEQPVASSPSASEPSPPVTNETNVPPQTDLIGNPNASLDPTPEISPESRVRMPSTPDKTEEMSGLESRINTSNRDIPFASMSSSSASNGLAPEEETSGIYIQQAGLVLLHPFLANYLRGVGLVEANYFRDDIAQQTAIYLLHYLTTRQTSAPEYELVLPKLLCGWPLNEALMPNISLPDTALEEGEQLLQTVIDYWDALKSTSPDGLRDGFLQREGKLTRTGDQSWKLQVEQMSIDVLLSRLPWGVSMVKLPWMDELLSVEWT